VAPIFGRLLPKGQCFLQIVFSGQWCLFELERLQESLSRFESCVPLVEWLLLETFIDDVPQVECWCGFLFFNSFLSLLRSGSDNETICVILEYIHLMVLHLIIIMQSNLETISVQEFSLKARSKNEVYRLLSCDCKSTMSFII